MRENTKENIAGIVWFFGPALIGLLVMLGVINTDDGNTNEPISPYIETCFEAPYGQTAC